MADNAHNSIPEAAPSAVPEIAAEGAVARTNTAIKAKPATRSRSTPRQKSASGKRTAKQRTVKLKERDNRFTSPEMIRAVEESFGRIDFDPCWHEASAVKPSAYLDIRKGQDGLTHLWQGPLAFVTPPWSAAKKFIERAYDQWLQGHADTIMCLVPSKTDTTFFHTVLGREADIYFVEKRPRFFKEDGTFQTTMASVMIVVFGATELQRMRFASRVPGSWWQPKKSPWEYASLTRGGQPRSTPDHSALSCSALPPRYGGHWTVLCTPIGV